MSRILYIRWGGICGFFFPFWNRHNPSIKENASDIHCLSEVTVLLPLFTQEIQTLIGVSVLFFED